MMPGNETVLPARKSLRLAHFYPTLMNLYGDRGNIICLRRRCESRGIELCVDQIGLGDQFDPAAYDLIFMGGGQDREQWRVSEDLLEDKSAALKAAIEDGMPALTVCGGYQLLGRYYQTADGRRLPGMAVYDLHTVHPGENVRRCIGNVVISYAQGELVGFENHGGRTYLGKTAEPLGRVVAGFGNNGTDLTEGCRYRNAFGTYIHGSLLPKNPHFADDLIAIALERKYGDGTLPPIDDAAEEYAHRVAMRLALAEQKHKRWTAWLSRGARRLPIRGRQNSRRG